MQTLQTPWLKGHTWNLSKTTSCASEKRKALIQRRQFMSSANRLIIHAFHNLVKLIHAMHCHKLVLLQIWMPKPIFVNSTQLNTPSSKIWHLCWIKNVLSYFKVLLYFPITGKKQPQNNNVVHLSSDPFFSTWTSCRNNPFLFCVFSTSHCCFFGVWNHGNGRVTLSTKSIRSIPS